jgi:hypothetical protein
MSTTSATVQTVSLADEEEVKQVLMKTILGLTHWHKALTLSEVARSCALPADREQDQRRRQVRTRDGRAAGAGETR